MVSRREFLTAAALARVAVGAPDGDGSMLWDYFLSRIEQADARRRQRLAGISTPEQVKSLGNRVRGAMREMIGAFPERTPLNARTTGSLDRPGYTIEKVIFESRPRFYVTANLYLPRPLAGPRGAVIHSCGHYDEAKAAPDYQRVCIGLALNGIVTLSYDPIGQGERLQYVDASGRSLLGAGTREHGMAGKAAYLTGATFTQYRMWDAMRALDYLETRPEVDSRRLGMVGHSGGGMMTLLTSPLDARIKAAMSCCAVTSFYHKTKAFLIADPEQIVPGIYAQGIDHPELIAAVAPRAFLIGAAKRDFVPLDGTRRTYDEVKRLFPPGRAGLVETDDEHKMNRELREACYGWMLEHLAGAEGNASEPPMKVAEESELWCTPRGRVADLPHGRTVFDFNRSVRQSASPLSPVSLLALPARPAGPKRTGDRIETEPGIRIPVTISNAEHHDTLLLIVSEAGRDSELTPHLGGVGVAHVEVRGWGATQPRMAGVKPNFPWEDFFAFRSFELGCPLLGMRVFDLLQVARVLRPEYKKLYAVGIGGGGLVALHAGASGRELDGVATWCTLASYRSVIETRISSEPVASFVPRALVHYDLPQLAASIRPRPYVGVGCLPAKEAARRILEVLA